MVVTIEGREPLGDIEKDSSIGSERGGVKSSTTSFEVGPGEDGEPKKNGTISKSDIQRVIHMTSDRIITLIPLGHRERPEKDTTNSLIIKFGILT